MSRQLSVSESLECFKTSNANVLCSLETVTTLWITNNTEQTVYVVSNNSNSRLRENNIRTIKPKESIEIVCRKLIGNNKDLLYTNDISLFKDMENQSNVPEGINKFVTNDEKVYIIQKNNEVLMVNKRANNINKLKSSFKSKKHIIKTT